MISFKRLFVFSLFCLVAGSFFAAEAQTHDSAPYSVSRNIEATVRPNHLVDSVVTVDILARNDEAARQMAERTVEVNEYFYDLEILEAYTLKADGRRIEARPEAVIKREKPFDFREMDSFDLDVKVTTIIFPDLSSGDRSSLTVKFSAKRPHPPGGIFRAWEADPAHRIASWKIRLDAPAEMALQQIAKGFEHHVESRDGRTVHEWSLRRLPYRISEPGSVSVHDRGPYVMVSSFSDWEAVGRTYCEPVQPLMAVTPDVARLAAEITRGREGSRAQAQAIHEWVVANIRYTNVVLGAGGIVPRTPDSVLANRYGDCKDHTTLIRALLAARGIASEYALVNASNPTYQSPPIPALGFDHVIVYVPDLDIYADGTAKYLPFGTLPASLYDKPTLRCSERSSKMTRIHPIRAEENKGVITTDIVIGGDGKASGSTIVEASGPALEPIRSLLSDAAVRGTSTIASEGLQAAGLRGSAWIESQTVDDAIGRARVDLHFSVDDEFLGLDNARAVIAGPALLPKPFLIYGTAFPANRMQDFVCIPQTHRQITRYRLPPGWRHEALPPDVSRRGGPAEYTARYTAGDGTVEVERTFVLRGEGSVCPSGLASDMGPVFNAAIRDTENRISFVRDESAPEATHTARPGTGPRDAAAATPPYSVSEELAWRVLPDHTIEELHTSELKAMTSEGAEQIRQRWLTKQPGETLEIIEAATIKADGRRLTVPADKIMTRGIGKSATMYVVLFPDVSEGDSVRYITRKREPDGATPGGIFLTAGFDADAASSRRIVSLEVPAHMPLHISATGFKQKSATENDITRYEWVAEPLPYHPRRLDELSVFLNQARSISVSSYADWKTAGSAYCGPANNTAIGSPEIGRLADEITAGRPDQRGQAAAIVDWVSANIKDNGAVLTGDWVPAAPSLVAATRQGSGNDRAALARAFLAVRNIEAHFTLAKGSRVFAVDDVPSLNFGQVLLYLPEWNLYADPSNPLSGFGVLKDEDYGTQALRCGPGEPSLTSIPTPVPEDHTASVAAELTIGRDGKLTGKAVIAGKGAVIAELRQFRNDVGLKGADAILNEKFTGLGLRGSAILSPVVEDGAIKLAFTLEGPVLGEENAKRVIAGPPVIAKPFRQFEAALRANREAPFFCFPTTYRETVVYKLPKGWTARNVPRNVTRTGGPAEYRASYKVLGDQIEIDRSFLLRTSTSVCPPQIAAEILSVTTAAARDDEARLILVAE
jgi:transglutaminase-like putative cysteine protease